LTGGGRSLGAHGRLLGVTRPGPAIVRVAGPSVLSGRQVMFEPVTVEDAPCGRVAALLGPLVVLVTSRTACHPRFAVSNLWHHLLAWWRRCAVVAFGGLRSRG
jgi:hypothetical protein